MLPVIIFPSVDISVAQETPLDSLTAELKRYTAQDTVRLQLLIAASDEVIWNNTDSALEYAMEAGQLSKQLDWPKGRALALKQLGVVHNRRSNYLKAMDYLQEALKISESLSDKNLMASLYNNLASIHADFEQYDKAFEYYKEVLLVAEETGQRMTEIIALTNIGILHLDLVAPDSGRIYLQQALNLAKDEGNQNVISVILNNLALAYDDLEAYSQAINNYEEAISIAESIGNKQVKAASLHNISKIQLKQENYTEAEENGLKALALAKEINSLQRESEIWKNLSRIYEQTDQSIDALAAYRNHVSLRDSILSEDNKAEVTRKEMQFEMEKKEALASAELQRERFARNAIIAGGVALLLVALYVYWSYKKRRDALAQKQQADFEVKVARTELKALLSQMNPHFIFNSLNSISDYISKHDTETANNYLIKFANLMRMTLESSEKREISLADDLKLVETYLEIESLRLNRKFEYEIKVGRTIDVENTLIPPLILQPYIENSIWHGMSNKEDAGKIVLEIKQEGNSIIYSVDDNGIGRQLSLNNNGNKKSFGTKISQSRVEIINRLKGTNGNIKMIDKPQGLRVEVKLPLELAF
ncbi:MAG: tetratricopeptide repeat-containing sensor histidine kinase [Cyclobacteriaceae bacterium]